MINKIKLLKTYYSCDDITEFIELCLEQEYSIFNSGSITELWKVVQVTSRGRYGY